MPSHAGYSPDRHQLDKPALCRGPARAPQPLELLEYHGDTPAEALLAETLGLSKLNWNTTDFSCDEPMTLAFADRVGEILAELPAGVQPQPDYRYYM